MSAQAASVVIDALASGRLLRMESNAPWVPPNLQTNVTESQFSHRMAVSRSGMPAASGCPRSTLGKLGP